LGLNTAVSVIDNVRIVVAIVVQERSEGSPVFSDSSIIVTIALGVCVLIMDYVGRVGNSGIYIE
jgi:hypothetical protein